MKLRAQMLNELNDKKALIKAKNYAFEYIDTTDEKRIYPSEKEINALQAFHEDLNQNPCSGEEIIEFLAKVGTKGTITQTGGRYFGFVNGGIIPAALSAKWLADVWDQCGGLYLTSPINAELEMVCEHWLKDLLGLPKVTIAGFVSGTSMANLSALAAARHQLLKNRDWDISKKGFNGAPKIRIITHDQVHASIKKTLVLLGFGICDIEWVPSDDQGRVIVSELPELDDTCLVLLQAGNANTGAFDNFNAVCDLANKAGAWVHIDGAFGLWAAATDKLSYLTNGIAKASSWAVDGHKTLNTPYDSGIVLCRHPQALLGALQATGEYIIYSDRKDPLLSTPELSKRSRAIELWATMKFLGKRGIDELITGFHEYACKMAKELEKMGYILLNAVVFNQILVRSSSDEKTNAIIKYVQESGVCWVGGTYWHNSTAIRISICSWRTSDMDIDRSIKVFKEALLSVT